MGHFSFKTLVQCNTGETVTAQVQRRDLSFTQMINCKQINKLLKEP